MAGKIFYLPPVDYASGKLFGKKYKFTAVYRRSGSHPNGCATTSTRDERNHPYSAAEIAHQQKFKSVVKATHTRMADPTQKAKDTLAFRAQHTYPTLFSDVFHQVWDTYTEE